MSHTLWSWSNFCVTLRLIHSAVPHLERSAVPSCHRCLQSHLVSQRDNLGAWIFMWPKSYKHKECVRLFQMSAQDCLPAPIAPDVLANDSVLSATLSICLCCRLRFSNSPAFFCRGFFKESCSFAFVHIWTANTPHVSYLSKPWSPSWQHFQIYHVQTQVLLVYGQFFSYLISIKSHVSWHTYQFNPVMFCQFH